MYIWDIDAVPPTLSDERIAGSVFTVWKEKGVRRFFRLIDQREEEHHVLLRFC